MSRSKLDDHSPKVVEQKKKEPSFSEASSSLRLKIEHFVGSERVMSSLGRVQKCLHDALNEFQTRTGSERECIQRVVPQLMEGLNGPEAWRLIRSAAFAAKMIQNAAGMSESETRHSLGQAVPLLNEHRKISLQDLETSLAFVMKVAPAASDLNYREIKKFAQGLRQGLFLA